MIEFVKLWIGVFASTLSSRAALQAENLALRHQLCVYQRSVKRPSVRPADRILWSLLARAWAGWKDALIFVKPDTVIGWQRKRFKEHWRKLSGAGEPGRPPVADEVKDLIRTMSSMNPTWGSQRIMGELVKIGITVTKSTVDRYRVRVRKPPSPTWRAFLKNHAKKIVSIDFMVAPIDERHLNTGSVLAGHHPMHFADGSSRCFRMETRWHLLEVVPHRNSSIIWRTQGRL